MLLSCLSRYRRPPLLRIQRLPGFPNDIIFRMTLCDRARGGRARSLGLLKREGEGRRGAPFLYWLPEQEAVWRTDPRYLEEERRREAGRWILQSIAEANGLLPPGTAKTGNGGED